MKTQILSLFILGISLLLSPYSWGQWRNSCSGVFIVDEMAEKYKLIPGLENYPASSFYYKESHLTSTRSFTRRESLSVDRDQRLGNQSVMINEIHYSQSTAVNNYMDNIHTVLKNAQQIRSGELNISDLPIISVYRDSDGIIWTLDHRRLVSLRLAGYEGPLQVRFVSANVANRQSFKKTTPNGGQSLLLKIDSNLSVEVK